MKSKFTEPSWASKVDALVVPFVIVAIFLTIALCL